MKNSILISVFLIIGYSSFAKENNIKKEKKEHLNYDEYVQKYGVNDTSIAIINVYFDKKYNAGAGQMSFLPLTLALSIITPPIGISLTLISTPIFINGVITSNRYSDKNLVKALNNYQSEQLMSDRIRKKVIKYMVVEQEYQEYEKEEQAKEYLFALKKIR